MLRYTITLIGCVRMEKSSSMLKLEAHSHSEHDGFKCDECDVSFVKPLLATVRARGGNETYYACPRCLSKVKDAEESEEGEDSVAVEKVKRFVASVKSEDAGVKGDVKCGHFMGYLKKRSRDMSIPDECLTCDKMIECMAR